MVIITKRHILTKSSSVQTHPPSAKYANLVSHAGELCGLFSWHLQGNEDKIRELQKPFPSRMDFSFPFVFEILLFLPPPVSSSPPCDFFPFSSVLFFLFLRSWRPRFNLLIIPLFNSPPYSKPTPFFLQRSL